ncbi:MAG TPA: 30S ribosome-binding factor RbfA [Candidatus Aphodomonas merdavium]|nr:30S ribosome-binding factor RbfA [Candidatus Aphodomonas merdavium]
MNFDRTDRISEEVRREIDRIIREEVRDPRVCGTWSITRAEVTRDLRYAKVRVSVLEEEQRKPLLAALKSASGFIRRQLGKGLRLRYIPELLFEQDDNIAYGVHIASILSDVSVEEGHSADTGEKDT